MEESAQAVDNTAVLKTREDAQTKEDVPGPSKSALKKAAKEAEKAKKKAETAAKLAERAAKLEEEAVDVSNGKYGVFPLIQSTIRSGNCPSKCGG